MKRKIVQQGAATLMVSLPSKWAKSQKLDKGDEVNIEESGPNLLISKDESTRRINSKKVDLSGFSPLINRALIALYVKGYDELELSFKDQGEIKDFQNRVIHELIGFEILKQTHNSLFIKDITGANIDEIDVIIKRLFFILDSMLEEFVEAIEKKHSLDAIIEIDTSVNKFAHFCCRLLNKKGYPDQIKTLQMYNVVVTLEEIGDSVKKLAREIKESKTKVDSSQISSLKEIRDNCSSFQDLLFLFDKDKVISFAKKYESIKRSIKNKNSIDFYLTQINEDVIKMNNYLLVVSADSFPTPLK